MEIRVTGPAREKLNKAFSESEFREPALRVVFSGFG